MGAGASTPKSKTTAVSPAAVGEETKPVSDDIPANNNNAPPGPVIILNDDPSAAVTTNDPTDVAREVFSKYDRDSSGTINNSEFRAFCADMGYYLSDEEVELDVKLLDSNGDGAISFSEFMEWWRRDNRFRALQLKKDELQILREIRKHFMRFDKDNSGCIDRKEFERLHKDLVRKRFTNKSVWVTLREFDLNRDGKISFNEYVQWILKQHRSRGKNRGELRLNLPFWFM